MQTHKKLLAALAATAGLFACATHQAPIRILDPIANETQRLRAELREFAQPFVDQWCAECHSGAAAEASLDLLEFFEVLRTEDGLDLLLDLRSMLEKEEMPPEDEPEPSDAERARMVRFVRDTIRLQRGEVDPGRVTMRRLSRAEYRNTVRDLFGIEDDVTAEFPADDLGYGFDNIGDALSLSVLHVEKYAAAARRVAAIAIPTGDRDAPPSRRFEAEVQPARGHVVRRGSWAAYLSRGSLDVTMHLPRAGDYRVRVRAYGQQAGKDSARMRWTFDKRRIGEFDVAAIRSKPAVYEQKIALTGGRHRLTVSYLNDFFDRRQNNPQRRDRNLWVDWIEVVGPLDRRPGERNRSWILARDPGGATPQRIRAVLLPMMRRVWRRPPTRDEFARIENLVAQAVTAGDTFAAAIQLGLQALLVSPHFLFRVEPGPPVDAPERATELVDDFALATRLAYYLWSSTPDAELDALADRGALRDPAALQAQVARMLDDPRSDALATNFTGQWLELRSLDDAAPDRKRFPTFDRRLRRAMRAETETFVRSILRSNRPVTELIDADYTFLNERLARHYGISGIKGDELRRVHLEDRRRTGLLSHASILTITSNPRRTSPVKRGKWILDNLLDDPPKAPPQAASFPPGKDLSVVATLRAQLAAHRADPKCAVCHNRMDAFGLALENFDPIGRWRDQDHGTAIDARGELPDGTQLHGPAALKDLLTRSDALPRSLAKRLFVYAIGREVRGTDEIAIRAMLESLGPSPSLPAIIAGVVTLDAFRRRAVRPAH